VKRSMPQAMRGLSLVELMVALVIGTILVLGMVQVFAASRAAYQLSEGMGRVQENGRFAMDFLQRDIRMAGHFGCVNDQARLLGNNAFRSHFDADGVLDFSRSIEGYDDASPTGLTLSPARVAGTDSLVLRFLRGNGVPVTAIDAATLSVEIDPDKWGALTDGGVASPQLFGIADCTYADVFAADSTNSGAGQVVAPAAVDDLALYGTNPGGGPALLYRAEALVYYIGIGAGGQPSLWRARIAADGSTSSEELVEGIENMQLRYGMDQNAASDPTGFIAEQGDAGDVGTTAADWRRVGQVQVALLAVSPNPATAVAAEAAPRLFGEAQTVPSDGRYRAVYETSIALRNRLYGN